MSSATIATETALPSNGRRAWLGPIGLGAAATAGVVFAGAVAPHGQAFYPQCPLYALTGVYCPGCGATRAVHALATGHLGAAFHDNLLLVVAIPIVLYLWWGWAARTLGRAGPPALRLPSWTVPAILAVIVGFGVVRNLPFAPFTALAPLA